MITAAQTDYLLTLPKYAVDKDGNKMDDIHVNLDGVYDHRILLQAITETDVEYNFLLRIQRGRKYTLKLTLHCQDDESKECVTRVDYNSIHTNPIQILDTLPPRFHPFAGVVVQDSHIHYNVDGYKTAQWALPLTETEFTPKSLIVSEFSINFAEVISGFAQMINLQTTLIMNDHRALFS